MKNYDEKEKRTLAVYIFIFFLLVAGITTSGYVSYRNFKREFRHQAENQILAIAELKVNELVNWRKERLSDGGFLYHNPAFSELVERYFENPDDVDAQAQLLAWLDNYQVYNQYDRVQLLDATGSERFSVPAAPDKVETHWVIDAAASLRSGKIVFLDFHRDTSAGYDIHLAILVPIFADKNNNHPLGVLVLSINPQTYLYPYIQNWPTPSDTAETLLVRRDGEDVLFLNELRFEKNAALNLRHPLTSTDIPAVKAVLGQTGIVEGMDYRGEQVLADVRAVPDSPWFLISKMDTAEMYAPLRARLWQTLLIIGMANFVAGTGLALVWRQQRILFYRTKVEATEALRESEEKFRKAFVLSPDSININRLQDGMHVSINNGFTKITGYAADEVIGKTSLELNIWADPQDRKKLVEGLTKDGEVENLETRFRMKNGEIRYGLMSASLLELDGIPHIISITRDVTERKYTEERLIRFSHIFEDSLNEIYIFDADDLHFIQVNRGAQLNIGYSMEELTKMTPLDIKPAYTLDKFLSLVEPLRSGVERKIVFETVHQRKNGSHYLVEVHLQLSTYESHKAFVAIILDITERRQAENALRENEEKYRRLFDNAPLGVFQSTLEGKVISINPAFAQMLGYDSPEDALKSIKNISTDIFADPNRRTEIIHLMAENPDLRTFENVYRRKDGSTFIGNLHAMPVRAADGRLLRMEGIVEDITERKQAEERLEQFFFVNLDLLCVADLEGNFVKVNKAWESILGYSTAELEQRKFLAFVHPEDMKSTLEAMSTLGKQEQVLNFVNRYRCMDGSYRFIEWRSQPSGNLIYAAARDITERKQAEEALRESEEKMRSIFRVAPTGIGVVRDRILVEVNPRISEMTEYTKEELIGQSARMLYPTQEEFEWVGREKYKQIVEKGSGVLETRWQKRDGSIIDVLLASTPIDIADPSKGVTFTALNITERKQAEEELGRQTALFRNLFESSPEAIAVLDREDRVLEVNRSFETLFGYPETEARGRYINDLLAPGPYLDDAQDVSQGVLRGGQVVEKESVRCTKDGRPLQVSLIGYPIVVNWHMIGAYAIYRDITERKRVEEALKENEAIFSSFLEHSPVYVFFKDKEIRSLRLSKNYEQMLGMPISDMLGKTMDELFPSDFAKGMVADDLRILNEGRRITVVEELNGHVYETTKFPVLKDGKPYILAGFTLDVTERKRIEEDLRESQIFLDSVFNGADLPIAVLDMTEESELIYVGMNTAYERTAGILASETIGRSLADILFTKAHAPTEVVEQTYQNHRRCLQLGETIQYEEGLILFGQPTWWLTSLTPLRNTAGRPGRIICTTLNITERKQAEEALYQQNKYLLALQETALELVSQLDLDILLKNIVKRAGQIMGTDSGYLDLTEPVTGQLLPRIGLGALAESLQHAVQPGEGVAGTVWQTGKPFIVNDYDQWSDRIGSYTSRKIRAVIGVPLLYNNKLLGVLGLAYEPDTTKIFSAEDVVVLEQFAQLAAIAIMNASLFATAQKELAERKQAEEALLESEERFRTHYDNATIGLYRTTPDGRILMLNPAGIQMLGYDSFDEIAKRNLEDVGFDAAKSRREFREKLEREGVVIGLESKWTRKDDSTIFVRESAKAFRDGNGKILYYDGSFEDVSGRVQAEAALRESEKLYRKMNENSPLGMHFYKLEGEKLIFVGANPAADKLLGVENSQFIGKTIEEAFPPLVQTEVPQRYREAAANGSPWATEQIAYEGGQIRGAFEVKAFQTTPGNMVAVFADITARKQAEEALRESEALYRQAIEVADAVPYRQSYHVNGKTVDYDFIGEGIRQITGYGPEEFTEVLWDSLTQERLLLEDLAEYSFDEAIERVRSGVSSVWKCNHRIRARDGSIHWVFEAAVELRDQNGISHGSIGLFQDITARKQAEEEIRQLNLLLEQRVVERTAQLENTNKELEAFSYSVSHDLRAPLRGIDGWSQALLEDYYEKLDEQGLLYINRVRSETQRMGHLIDDMLQLSRLTRTEMVKEQVDLSALAQPIVERLKRNEPQHQVDFNIQAGLIAEGDLHLLESVLVNLLGNAFKFTGKRANARIEFGQTELQGRRVFFVRDNGAGFDMAYSQKMFGAFQRMHKTSEFPGTGIGLATVQRIIHRHGGHVWAEAEVERGATFYFTLG